VVNLVGDQVRRLRQLQWEHLHAGYNHTDRKKLHLPARLPHSWDS